MRADAWNAFSKVRLGWGRVFSAAEQQNRRTTFIAAYRLAKEKPDLGDPVAFAERAIQETQFTYNRGTNRVGREVPWAPLCSALMRLPKL